MKELLKVGDRVRVIKPFYHHAKIDSEFTVVKVSPNLINLDGCSCPLTDTHHGPYAADGLAYGWDMPLFHEHFEKIEPVQIISHEEAAKAVSLPSVMDVASFFGIKEKP